ncbi:MAG: hypothetical protein HKL90_08020 [Elusimicrobia bacterium]|nr:hypothetical protein [Elusimicrobiota bacterium]
MAETLRLGQAEFRFYLTARIFDAIHRLAGVVLYLGLAYIGFLTVRELAGKTTVANFLLAYITTGAESHGWA